MANIVDRPESLQEHLRHQLGEMDLTPEMLKMCERVISSLSAEDGGYLRLALADLLPPDSGQEEMEIAESALAVIQALDPPGVAARDLTECLLLQIKDEMPYIRAGSHTEDGKRMKNASQAILTITQKQWQELVKLLKIEKSVINLED